MSVHDTGNPALGKESVSDTSDIRPQGTEGVMAQHSSDIKNEIMTMYN